MTFNQDPPRLLDPAAPTDPQLRDLLRAASTHTPSAAQLEVLAIKVAAVTAAGAGAGAGAGLNARWLAGKAGVAKVSVGLLIAGAASWLAWSASAPRGVRSANPEARTQQAARNTDVGHQQAPARRSAAATQQEPQATSRAAEPSAAVIANKQPSAQPAAPRAPVSARDSGASPSAAAAPRRSRRSAPALGPNTSPAAVAATGDLARIQQPAAAAAKRASGAAPATPNGPSELSLLSRAQNLLARNPQGALDVMDEHARLYPHGQFTEEREALSIDALGRLDRRQEARTRARAFLQHYPSSPHRERIATWLQ